MLFLSQSDGEGRDPSVEAETEGEEEEWLPLEVEQESVYANSYVDLGKVDTVGFDYDYTLVTYTKELLELIYDMSLKRLVEEKEYPREMLEVGMKFDPFFSIRGECEWLCLCLCLCVFVRSLCVIFGGKDCWFAFHFEYVLLDLCAV